MNDFHVFLTGAIWVEHLVIALFFLRYRQKTHDRFFTMFSCAFLLFAVERILIFISGANSEFMPLVYLFRLAAFSMIIAAIVSKNRETGRESSEISIHP